MRFNHEKDYAHYSVRSYQPGEVSITTPITHHDAQQLATKVLHESFIIAPKRLIPNWPPRKLTELTAEHLDSVAELKPELILLGTGQTLDFPHPSVTANLMVLGIGVEVMDTSAACRTYNILMHEGRNVVAALIVD